MSLTKSFLVVSESAMMRQLIMLSLKMMGCTSIVDAPNGSVALKKLEGAPVDVVLTDIDMPEMNGLEFIRTIRPKYPSLPIVLLSTHGDESGRDKGLTLGANDCLTKPLSGAKIKEVVEKLFPGLNL